MVPCRGLLAIPPSACSGRHFLDTSGGVKLKVVAPTPQNWSDSHFVRVSCLCGSALLAFHGPLFPASTSQINMAFNHAPHRPKTGEPVALVNATMGHPKVSD